MVVHGNKDDDDDEDRSCNITSTLIHGPKHFDYLKQLSLLAYVRQLSKTILDNYLRLSYIILDNYVGLSYIILYNYHSLFIQFS